MFSRKNLPIVEPVTVNKQNQSPIWGMNSTPPGGDASRRGGCLSIFPDYSKKILKKRIKDEILTSQYTLLNDGWVDEIPRCTTQERLVSPQRWF